MNRLCKTCNIKKDKNNYLEDRTVCRNCYIKNRSQIQSPKSDDKKKTKVVDSVNNNRIFIIRFSNCGKIYLKNHILFEKQEPFFIFTKSLNQYRNIKAQTSDEIQPLNDYENNIVVFDDMLPSKQESNIDLFFTRGRHNNIDIHYISQSYFHLPKNTIRNNSNINILFKQTLRVILLIFHDIAGLNMNLEEWKQLCRKA